MVGGFCSREPLGNSQKNNSSIQARTARLTLGYVHIPVFAAYSLPKGSATPFMGVFY
jgi:hypothetical protein